MMVEVRRGFVYEGQRRRRGEILVFVPKRIAKFLIERRKVRLIESGVQTV